MKLLTVLLQSDDPALRELLGYSFDGLVRLRERLMLEMGLLDISFLRGDYDFCMTMLEKPRDYPVMAILDKATYDNLDKKRAVMSIIGPQATYKFIDRYVDDFIIRVEQCVRDFIKNHKS